MCTIFAQQRPGDAWYQLWRGVDQLGEESTPTPPPSVDDTAEDTLANTAYPKVFWRQPWFPQQRFDREVRRRTDAEDYRQP